MNNDSDRDGNSSGDLVVEPAAPMGDRAVTVGEQSAATPGTRVADPGILQHFQAALVNLISEASKIGLSLPIGLGVSSPYELTTPGTHPPGRLRSEVHITIPDTQARQSTEETPQDHIEDFEGRKQRKGKGVINEESREERDQVRTHGVNSSDTYQRNRRRHRSISSEDKSPRPRRELRSKRTKRRRSESTEDRRSPDERGNHGRMTIKSRLDPAGEPTGRRDVTLQELSRKVSKMALALITAARKLRPYFQAHRIRVYTNCPLKLILQKPEVSGRLTKWAIELSEFDVEYLPRTAIKAQAVQIS
ncbi:hypothetical protein LWI29_005884 [Acer saccharum]|uniref:Reverse transcriptase RNase H-like domain-containing protein n=1 Tax=Acer saccharum TaxID=4024 RepID=A0AA39SFG8_ACESA|nr:hypothetical protein LWI29_005884 [Acer saccharum]